MAGNGFRLVKGGNLGESIPEGQLRDVTTLGTARENILDVLEDSKEFRNRDRTELFGEKLIVPKNVSEKLDTALGLVKTVFGKKFNPKDAYFENLPGNMVGESLRDGRILIDPALLRHPAGRIAHILAHEAAHDKKLILNEALVEGYVKSIFHDDINMYEESVGKFEVFAKTFRENRTQNENTKEIYELYAQRRYEDLYEVAVEKNEDASELFFQVFPELTFKNKKREGYTEPLPIPSQEKLAA